MHVGHSANLQFVIDEEVGRWYCFGNCPPAPGVDYRSGDVIDLHRIVNGFAIDEAVKDILELPMDMQRSAPSRTFFCSKRQKTTVDRKLIARVLQESSFPKNAEKAEAKDFAELLEEILRPDDLPIVSSNLRTMRIGAQAREWLRRRPEALRYLVCSTALREDTWSRRRNIKERIFLDVEFDEMPSLDEQLKILWWLKTAQQWNLVSITFSGGKSHHGLFYVRGQQVQDMIALAKRLGACSKSLQPNQLIRFPGGGNGRQTIVYLNRQINRWLIGEHTKKVQVRTDRKLSMKRRRSDPHFHNANQTADH